MTFQPSMAHFLDFTRSRPVGREYTFTNWEICACAQYARTIEVQWFEPGGPGDPFWWAANELSAIGAHLTQRSTFGRLSRNIAAFLEGRTMIAGRNQSPMGVRELEEARPGAVFGRPMDLSMFPRGVTLPLADLAEVI